MTACLVGTYDRGHSANRLLAAALADAGFALEELHEPLWETTREKGRRYFGPAALAGHAARWAAASARLARRWRARAPGPPPLVVVGFGGQLDVLLAAAVCRPRAALLFAPLVSLTETLVEDRAVFRAGGAAAAAVRALDRAGFRAADLVLADTAAHAAWLAATLGAPRVGTWHFGVEPEFLQPVAARPEPGRVLFTGRHLPLHGVETIVAAAARLGARAQVECIGNGPERARTEALARTLGAPVRFRDEVPLDALPGELARASVVLGVFGAGAKAAMVVPNKVYQAAAAGRALVTRDGPALREVLEPGLQCVAVPPADPAALADAIAALLDDPAAAARLGATARMHVEREFGPARTAERLAALLRERLGVVPAGRAPAPCAVAS